MSLKDLLLGRRLANREYGRRKIGAFEGVPAMGLDGLGSSAYGPEAALTILLPLGAAGFSWIGWVMAPIVGLLAILFVSYWQTIRAYPNNGGAYIVSKDNLGTRAGLLAAAALMVDYVLNVAVGISAGVGALVSAAPGLHPFILPLCLAILALVTIVNLRGTLDAGRLFALPTYLFVLSFAVIMGIGLYKALQAGGHPAPVVTPPALPRATQAVSLWLLLRAFAAGCTAMTGVEAVSNGMSAFKDPPVHYGHRTLATIVVLLGALLCGVAWLAPAYHVGAMDQNDPNYRSVLAQLAAAVAGTGALYYVAMASLLAVLALSANTSFVDFPRLCRMVAEDGFLPRPFAIAGRRLVFSVGILYLAGCAGTLLTVFGGITDRLIPLFAIGAFLTFTLSQAGMVVHWRKSRERGRHLHLLINLVGAITTGIALVVIVAAKFTEGAWITVLVIPLVIGLLLLIRRYYDAVANEVGEQESISGRDIERPVVIVPVEEWDRLARKALSLALSLSPDVIGVHLTGLAGPQETEQSLGSLKRQWAAEVGRPAKAAGLRAPRLVVVPAEYRAIHEPLLKLVDDVEAQFPGRTVSVLIPEIVKTRWYQHILHPGHAAYLRRQLLQHGSARITVMSVPWKLDELDEPRGDRKVGREKVAHPSKARAQPQRRTASSGRCARRRTPIDR